MSSRANEIFKHADRNFGLIDPEGVQVHLVLGELIIICGWIPLITSHQEAAFGHMHHHHPINLRYLRRSTTSRRLNHCCL
jgi:hypothetical protein